MIGKKKEKFRVGNRWNVEGKKEKREKANWKKKKERKTKRKLNVPSVFSSFELLCLFQARLGKETIGMTKKERKKEAVLFLSLFVLWAAAEGNE